MTTSKSNFLLSNPSLDDVEAWAQIAGQKLPSDAMDMEVQERRSHGRIVLPIAKIDPPPLVDRHSVAGVAQSLASEGKEQVVVISSSQVDDAAIR